MPRKTRPFRAIHTVTADSHIELAVVTISDSLYTRCSNPLSLSPHDALKHHFISLKTDLIILHSRVLERKFP